MVVRRVIKIFAASILFLSLFLQYFPASANNGNSFPVINPKLKVLEIVDFGDSSIKKTLEDTGSFLVETVTMKQFVASREELDGKYDFIAISDGKYTKQTVKELIDNGTSRAKAHETTNIQNDITNLKATEIVEQFINKGQPIILERHSVKNDGILESNFGRYNGSNKNIIMYTHNGNSDNDNKCSWLERVFGLCDSKKENPESKQQDLLSHTENFLRKYHIPRPRFELTQKPSELSDKYKPGDNLAFNINMLSSIDKKDLKAILYIDSDFNDKYEPSESVMEVPITSVSNTAINYKLPRGYSGIRNWKLEVVDLGTSLKDYQKGSVYFKDEIVEIDVLQVTKDTNKSSSLKESKNMNQDFLSPKSGEYKINIDVTDMGTFRNSSSEFSHSKINGKYDMLIFGFADSYNNAEIPTSVVNSVEQFIDTNQSILFTHDTIFETNNNWVNNFMDDTGQIAPLTNLGHGAPNPSTSTQKMNEGMMTKYPFVLGGNIEIALTHNQYYTLDLEDPDVIPWYNITGQSRDPYDSYNHYYTYSKGNITYSGSGHTSTGFKPKEQELFVNTMYRAFLGSNHAPIITVSSPQEQAVVPEHQNIELSYKVEDFDLKDKKLDTRVYLNNILVYSQDNVTNGTTIVESIQHGIVDTSKDGSGIPATIKIEAIDENGAIAEKITNIKIVKVSANLEVSRQVSSSDLLPVGDSVTLNYLLKPKNITLETGNSIGVNEIRISNIKFSEKLPANLEVQVPKGFVKTGTIESGYTITADLQDIQYKRGKDNFSAMPLEFNFTVTPKEMNDFTLGNSSVSFEDINNKNETAEFNNVTIRAKYKIENIELPDSLVVNKNIPENLRLKLKIFPDKVNSNDIVKEIIWSIESERNIFTIDAKTGVITANGVGEGYVTVKVTDLFGNVHERTTLISVRIPVESIVAEDITMKVGEIKGLPVSVNPSDARNVVTIELIDSSLASVNKDSWEIKGNKPGQTYLIAKGVDKEGNVVEARAMLIIEEVPITKINVESEVTINVEETYQFEVTYEPKNATNKKLKWVSQNPRIAEVIGDGKIKGLTTGITYIDVFTENGKTLLATIKVTVGAPLKKIDAINPIVMKIGTKKQLFEPSKDNNENVLHLYPRNATNIIDIAFESSNGPIADVNKSGLVTANRIGQTSITIRVRAKLDNSNFETHEVRINVKVIEESEDSDSGNDDGSESDDDLY